MTSASWVGIHLFTNEGVYGQRFDEFLINQIAPAVIAAVDRRLCDRWFFIRYGDGGPHLRLRLRARDQQSARVLGVAFSDVSQAIQNEDEVTLATSRHLEDHYGLSRRVPPGSMKLEPYVPEIDRFGGVEALRICEAEFCSSSKAVVDVLSELAGEPSSSKLAIGLYMMLSTLETFLGPTIDRLRFARNLMRAYLDAEIGFVADTLWRDDAALHQFLLQDYQQLPEPLAVDAAREAFDERFASRSDYLVAAVSRVGHAVARGEVNQLNPWRAHQSDSYVKLVHCALSGRLRLSHFRPIDAEQSVATIAGNLIHLNANRLGLDLNDEAWLAYLYSRWLEQS